MLGGKIVSSLAYLLRFPLFLFEGPLLALLLRSSVRRLPGRARGFVAGICVLLVVVELLTTLSPISFRGFWLQEVNLELAYVAVCLLIMMVHDNLHQGRGSVLEIAAIGLLPLLFWSFWVDYWRSDPIDSQEHLSRNVVVNHHSGGAFAQNWEAVTVVQRYPAFPILERQLLQVRMGITDDCNPNTVRVEVSPIGLVTVRCGPPGSFVFGQMSLPK